MDYKQSYDAVLKKKRRDWFLTAWKPCGKCYQCPKRRSDCGKNPCVDFCRGRDFVGSACYDEVKVQLEHFESEHTNTKWAYSVHEKGHTIDNYEHSQCEHKHIVIDTENPCSGSSVQKMFQGAWIEPARYTIGHCARYLLHLTVSSMQKERISASDLYCSGKGEHGTVWFEISSPVLYDSFNKDNILHYVFNEDMTTLFKFISRFGSSCSSGVNYQSINAIINIWNQHNIEFDYVKEIWDTMKHENQVFVVKEVLNIPLDKAEFVTFEELKDDNFFIKSQVAWDFQRLYIWLHNYSGVARDDLVNIMKYYDMTELLKINNERKELKNIIDTNSVFGENLVESSIVGET
jgi:hypothetical protein